MATLKILNRYAACWCITIITLSSCNKTLFDYRYKYIGKWSFSVTEDTFNGATGEHSHSTYIYPGEIKFGNNNDEIEIYFAPGNMVTLKISKDGILSNFPTHYCSGEFNDPDRIKLYIRYGGLGGGESYDVQGKKK